MRDGHPRMVDISAKRATRRAATARGAVRLNARALRALRQGTLPKGDALAAARIAGILAAKETWRIVPLCHPIAPTSVDISFETVDNLVEIEATVRALAPTGVEMEALCAVSAAALTVYDMCKALDPAGEIVTIFVDRKEGGKGGPWRRTGLSKRRSSRSATAAPGVKPKT
jgi:cyclic pyranopterin phosphate synthase